MWFWNVTLLRKWNTLAKQFLANMFLRNLFVSNYEFFWFWNVTILWRCRAHINQVGTDGLRVVIFRESIEIMPFVYFISVNYLYLPSNFSNYWLVCFLEKSLFQMSLTKFRDFEMSHYYENKTHKPSNFWLVFFSRIILFQITNFCDFEKSHLYYYENVKHYENDHELLCYSKVSIVI